MCRENADLAEIYPCIVSPAGRPSANGEQRVPREALQVQEQ